MARVLVRPSRSWSIRNRLLYNVQEDENGCWLWLGDTDKGGYGHASKSYPSRQAHRAAYLILVGPIPDGLTLDHDCEVRLCVNPDHLIPRTRVDNTMRAETGITVINKKKTHCSEGHEYTPENTYVTPKGWRRCITCKRKWGREWMAEKRSENAQG